MPAAGSCKRYLRAGAWLDDLQRLHKQGLSDSQIARELSVRYPGQHFTRRRVWHWRHLEDRMSQMGECIPRDRMDLEHRRRVHQMIHGLGHLLPTITLRYRETDILALLRKQGPRTGRQIREALRLKHLRSHGQYWFVRLRLLGLLERDSDRHYRVALAALPLV